MTVYKKNQVSLSLAYAASGLLWVGERERESAWKGPRIHAESVLPSYYNHDASSSLLLCLLSLFLSPLSLYNNQSNILHLCLFPLYARTRSHALLSGQLWLSLSPSLSLYIAKPSFACAIPNNSCTRPSSVQSFIATIFLRDKESLKLLLG